jgi:cell division control protein 6
MARNVFSDLGAEQGIFRDERALQPEYLPEVLPHREAQVKEIALALRGAAQGKRPENVVVVGKPGTGKTATVRFVLKQLSEYSGKVSPLYINCWEFSTRHAVLAKVSLMLGEFMPRRGIAADEILERIVEVMRKEKKTAIIALDEIDRLLAGRNGEEKVLYDLLRAGETYGVTFGVVGITNSEDFLAKLDSRIRSSLAQREVGFARYTPAQLKDILSERAKTAFFPGTLSPEAVPVCAAHAAKNGGDARLGIAMLWKAGKLAEEDGSGRVDVAHCRKAFSDAESAVRVERLSGLNEVERRIIELASAQGGIVSGELYSALSSEFKETDRTVRNYIDKLESLKLVSVEERPRDSARKGNTRIISARKE